MDDSTEPEAATLLSDRMTDRVEFVFALNQDALYDTHDQAGDFDEVAAIDRETVRQGRSLMDDAFPEGAPTHHLRVGELGRGGGVSAVIVDFVLVYGPALGFWSDAGRRVHGWWRRFRQRGELPALSLGALRLLAAADLAQRLGDDLRLLQAVDVGPGRDLDTFHTGADLFAIIFGAERGTWVYVLSSDGRIVHFGEGAAIPWAIGFYFGLDEPRGPSEIELPFLGDQGNTANGT